MDAQTVASLVLVVPAVILAFVVWRARRAGRTTFGLGLRDGGLGELGRGLLFAAPFLVVLYLVMDLTGLATATAGGTGTTLGAQIGSIAGIWVYFLVLFLVEEAVFRALLMTGIGVVAGRWAALVVTAVLVAAAYAFAPDTGILPLVGAVVTNLLHGWARWRSGRIWWGLGERWLWNCGVVTLGFSDSAFSLAHPALTQHLDGPEWVTGGAFGVEGGIVGIGLLLVMIAGASRFATGRHGPWRVESAG